MKMLLIFSFIFFLQSSFLVGQESKISLFVSPDTSLYHKPLKIEVTGIEPREQITIQVKAIDAEGNKWTSRAVFVADGFGMVNPKQSASISGSYTGVHPMGLFWSMKSKDDHQIATGKGYTATINVLVNDSMVARKTVYRRSTRELDALKITRKEIRDSLIADYYLPKSEKKVPAIIFLGGSGGQFRQERSSLFASEGFAVLNLKYFRYDGLPEGITEIPLEYVAKAYEWLKNQAEIDTARIGIMGWSMAAQLALLYAAHYDGLQYVVVEAPSNVVWFGWEDGKSSFTYKGKGFPYAEYSEEDSERIELEMKEKGVQYHDGPKFQSAFKNEEMINQSAIEVEKIKAPILFISGKEDNVWPSFMMSEMMMKRLEQRHFQYEYAHYSYDKAGHNFAGGGQGCGIPYLPPEDYSNSAARGGTDEGNALAAIKSLEEILRFISEH
ncbi:acyl-CoA thioesterase/BAAT N-terminal domain-containing protein [Cyclobacterium xiamenense]|uniref:acyl-CoA thioesterase/BAAT N-terminal domain-containing protein n=1 Tax=Cyclobacterium xiamenense TaxID=1297121 RepID=UPI0035D09BFB